MVCGVSRMNASPGLRIGVLTSLGRTLDAFFPELSKEWEAQGAQVFAAAGDPAKLMPSDVIDGLTQSPSLSNFKASASLAKWIDERSLDVVLTSTATASALVRIRKRKVPVVYFCHGLHWTHNAEFSPVWKSVERLLLGNTRAAIVSNSEDEAWLSRYLGSELVAKLPYGVGVPTERFPRTPASPFTGPLELAWIGDFSSRKQPLLAVEVAAHLKEAGVSFILTMAGSGPLEGEVASEIVRRGLQDQVHLPGRMDSGQLIAASQVLLHTSKWEGLARVLLEAAATGRNAYGFDVKGVRDAPSIKVVEPGNAHALASAILRDIEGGFNPQAFPDPKHMTSESQAGLVLDHLKRWVITSER
ncbi:glycosyl transferase, group 1 [Leifsonia rubra CMS 76R]|nr:glycosyl transferase, group 1 [Leifsonia rubra CMS 76R]